MTIKIFTRDENTVIQASAVMDDGSAYDQADITLIRLLRKGPRNDSTLYPATIASFTAGNAFEGTIAGTLPTEGYWGFQFEYTLASNSKPVLSRIFYVYVGESIISL